jgi:biopolymer transport protein ExbD
MAASSPRDTSSGLMTDINVTPLVDVMLVLLILMMVTGTAVASRTIAVQLPKAKSGKTDATKRPLVVGVDEKGALYLDTERSDEATVRAHAREAIASDTDASVVVAADGRARHEMVVRALDILRGEHVAKIAIVVRAEPGR